MADTDLAKKLSLQIVVELYREKFAMEWCKPTLQKQKHRLRIASKFSILTPLEAMFTQMKEYVTQIL